MKREEFLGVWRLLGITARGGSVHTSQTHLVVREDDLWEVWPGSIYYEGEPGPEHSYRFEDGSPGRIEEIVPLGRYCYLVARDGDTLRTRLGGVFGHFPDSIDDDSGDLSTYERVTGDEATDLLQPPPRVRRKTIFHLRLGELTYDDNVHWWRTTIAFGGEDGVRLNVTLADGADPTTAFDAAAEIVDRLDCEALKAHAATELLELHNDTWRDDDDGPSIDAATFASRMTPESLTIRDDGRVEAWFDDGDLFLGHVIYVNLDAQLRPVDAGIAG